MVAAALFAAILTILSALFGCVRAAETVIECSATRGDGGHWSWREIESKRCWYRGEPGRSKSLLRWAVKSPRSNAVEGRPEISTPDLGAAPLLVEPTPAETLAARAISNKEALWQADPKDQEKAFTCCWPDLAMARSIESSRVSELPRATPPTQPLWPLLFLPVIAIAVAMFLITRSLT